MGALAADRLRQKQGHWMKKHTMRSGSHKRDKTELFVKVMLETLDAPAWRALSLGARCLYIALKRRHRLDTNNNGKIFLSQRQAAMELDSKRDYVARWFRELEYYGFIVMTRHGSLGSEGRGKAPHWRLTELGYKNDPPTRDFLNWNGAPFQARKTRASWKSGTVVPWKSVTPKNKTLS
jgi:hypothetical protein